MVVSWVYSGCPAGCVRGSVTPPVGVVRAEAGRSRARAVPVTGLFGDGHDCNVKRRQVSAPGTTSVKRSRLVISGRFECVEDLSHFLAPFVGVGAVHPAGCYLWCVLENLVQCESRRRSKGGWQLGAAVAWGRRRGQSRWDCPGGCWRQERLRPRLQPRLLKFIDEICGEVAVERACSPRSRAWLLIRRSRTKAWVQEPLTSVTGQGVHAAAGGGVTWFRGAPAGGP